MTVGRGSRLETTRATGPHRTLISLSWVGKRERGEVGGRTVYWTVSFTPCEKCPTSAALWRIQKDLIELFKDCNLISQIAYLSTLLEAAAPVTD